MLTYPNINPVALDLGFMKIYWYGLIYLVSFIWLGFMGARSIRNTPEAGHVFQTQAIYFDFLSFGVLGVVLGGRLGYILFYAWHAWLADPWMLFRIWQGGMSFHGALIGVLLAVFAFARGRQMPILPITDFIAPWVPLPLALGRLGNFINGELWGRVTDLPWGMVYPHVDTLPRHPSQLYECLGEGFVLGLIMLCVTRKQHNPGLVSGIFLMAYACIRFMLEFFRQPDLQLGFLAWGWLTMGQLLSFIMLIFGLYLWRQTRKMALSSKE